MEPFVLEPMGIAAWQPPEERLRREVPPFAQLSRFHHPLGVAPVSALCAQRGRGLGDPPQGRPAPRRGGRGERDRRVPAPPFRFQGRPCTLNL